MTQEETAQHSAIILPFICHRDHATVAFVAAMSGLNLAYEQPIEPPRSAPVEVVKFASTAIRKNVVFHKEKQRVDPSAKKPCLVAPLTTPFSPLHTPHSAPPSISTVTPFSAPTKRKATRWNDLTEATRFRAASEYTERADGLAVSLNLSIGREASYLSDDRQTKITRLFQNRLNKELKASGLSGLPYAFSFELSPDGRLHLHGVIDGYGHDRDVIADALRKAAGEIPGRAKARQVKLNLVHDGAGWASYVVKERKRTATELKVNRLTIMSQSMSRLARQYHDEARNVRLAA